MDGRIRIPALAVAFTAAFLLLCAPLLQAARPKPERAAKTARSVSSGKALTPKRLASRRKAPPRMRKTNTFSGKAARGKRQSVARALKPKATAPLILIDPGHGGVDSGAMACGLVEKKVTLSAAKRLQKEFVRLGYRVKLTRSTDRTLSPRTRLRIASRLKPALFVSLHCNSAPSAKERGLETFAFLPKRRHQGRGSVVPIEEAEAASLSTSLAKRLHEYMARSLRSRGVVDNGARLGRFTVLAPKPWPSILVEMGYLTNKQDARLLASREHRARFAQSLARAVAAKFSRGEVLTAAKAEEGSSLRKAGSRKGG